MRPGDKVPEANLAEGDDAEVDRVEVVPSLPLGKHDGAQDQVEHHHPETSGRGDDDLGRHVSGGMNVSPIVTIPTSYLLL